MGLIQLQPKQYADSLYGTEVNAVHHYETKEVKDSSGKLILPKGKTVPGTLKFTIMMLGNYILMMQLSLVRM